MIVLLVILGYGGHSLYVGAQEIRATEECLVGFADCLDLVDSALEQTNTCIEKWEEDKYERQKRIFKWELCSGYENCWNCIAQTAEGNVVGDVEWCFTHALDGVTDGKGSEVLEDMLDQYFEKPRIDGPSG
jgi:hypothetical protein